jgi:hypothetical protein
MTHIWTSWPSVGSKTGRRHAGSAADLLAWLSGACAHPLVRADKLALPLWAPAAFRGDERRLHPREPGEGGYVEGVYALALDYDDAYAEAVRDAWGAYEGLVHTTYSLGATEKGGRPCAARQACRLVLPLARPVTADEYAALWAWADRTGRLAGLEADPGARDPSRGWFPPAEHPDRRGTLRVYRLAGRELLDPRPILDTAEAYRKLPPATTLEAPPFALEPPPPAPEASAPRPGHRSPPGALEAALERARELPASVSGQHGDDALYLAACELRRGFHLTEEDTMSALRVYNQRATPPWPETRLRHKAREAMRAARPAWGAYLAGAAPRPPGNSADPRDAVAAAERARAGGGRRGEVGFADLVTLVAAARPGLHHDAFLGGARDGAEPIGEPYVLALRTELSTRGVETTTSGLLEAVTQAALGRARNSLQEHLAALPPAEPSLLDDAAERYLHTDPAEQPLANVLLRKWLLSAVARAFRPGCQADAVLVLQGAQGLFKSTFFQVLAGDGRYLSLEDVGTKDVYVALGGRWICEIEEFDKLKGKRDAATVKAFVTQRIDVFRPPYGRVSVSRPRSYVIGATCNPQEFLYDPTGARRYWPVVVREHIDISALCRDRDALLAAACAALHAGEEWHLTRAESDALEVRHAVHTEHDEWETLVRAALDGPGLHGKGRFKLSDVARVALQLTGKDLDSQTQRRLGAVLRQLGCDRKQTARGSEWCRPTEAPSSGLVALPGGAAQESVLARLSRRCALSRPDACFRSGERHGQKHRLRRRAVRC